MKKYRLITIITMIALSTLIITGCGKKTETKVDEKEISSTIASTLAKQFSEEIKNEKDIEKVANKIAENKVLDIAVGVEEMTEESYFGGITTEVKGFKKSFAIRPMIGSIPFAAYIFEVENASDFEANIKDNIDLRWNICTEADDLETAVYDNYVFVVMSPSNFE